MKEYLTQKKFETFYDILCLEKGLHLSDKKRIRAFINSAIYVLKTGLTWAQLNPRSSAQKRKFINWSKKGVWKRLFNHLPKDETSVIAIDSTSIKVHPKAATLKKSTQTAHGIGRSKGGLTSKIHASCTESGKPLKFVLTGGQEPDCKQAHKLVRGLGKNKFVLGDKGYDSAQLVAHLEKRGLKAVIPSRCTNKIQRNIDMQLYKKRNVIERFFCRLKDFKRVFTRYDKTAASYMSFVHLAGALIWLS